jgi:hypothetical protein
MHTGMSQSSAQLLGIVVALILAAAIVYRTGPDDQTLFLVAVGFSLLASPLLEMHYLTLLLIPLALLRPRLDALWILTINVFWLSPHEPAATWQIALVLLTTTVLLLCAAGRPRPARAMGVAHLSKGVAPLSEAGGYLLRRREAARWGSHPFDR